MINVYIQTLIAIGSVGFFIAVYFAFLLSKETKEKYWTALAISALFLGIHQWTMLPYIVDLIPETTKIIIQQITAILGSIILAYALYGLYSAFKIIRKKTE